LNLQQRVWNYSRDRGLLNPGDTIVVGVSGGPDSLCLLDILARLAPFQRLTLHVAHLNHGLRPEAAAEADFVREQSEKRGLAFHLESADTRSWAADHKQSVEEAARNLRYLFLAAMARRVGAGRVAVAHTQDDQAETVLMHFLRGSGLAGLAGMEAKRVLPLVGQPPEAAEEQPAPTYLVRPLLDVTRAEVMAYCAEAGLDPRFDPSNLDPAYYRNRLRHVLLPELETYNPKIWAVLARSAQVLRGDFEWHSQAVEALWHATALTTQDTGRMAFDRVRWLQLTDAQQRALLRKAAGQLLGGLHDIGYQPIESAARFSRTAMPGRSGQVARGLSLVISAELVCLVVDSLRVEQVDSKLPLVQPGGRLAAGWRFETQVVAAAEWRNRSEAPEARWTVFVDGDRLSSPLSVRSRRPGDRFAPLGMGGHHMKLSDFMVNEKVPAAQRHRWPLVVGGDDIVWVAGLRLDERFRVRADSQRVIRLALIGPEPVEDK
jgi:tRNA(Ile)-lysidine synthetase-like protein